MKKTLTDRLLDLAEWIAPARRREWIEGLRTEASMADHPAGWAWGAVTTALGQRLADTVASGLALRMILGGFVLCVAASFAIFVVMRIPGINATLVRMHKASLPFVMGAAGIDLLLLSGGLAILLAHGTSWLNRYGRALFALGGLYIGFSLASAGFEHAHWGAATRLQHQAVTLSEIAAPFFIAAALALLFRRGRLFLVLASGAFAMQAVQYAVVLPHLHLQGLPLGAVAFFNACAPALLLLAGGGLLIERRAAATA